MTLAGNSVARAFCLVAVTASLLAGHAQAEDAQDTFDDLFGKQLRSAKGSRDTADDVDLALELLAAGRISGEYPELLSIICRSAYDLVIAVEDEQELAVAAMSLLAENVPTEAVAARQEIVKIRQGQFDASKSSAQRGAGERLIDSLADLAEAQAAADRVLDAVATMLRAKSLAEGVAPSREVGLFEAGERMAIRQAATERAKALAEELERAPGDGAVRAELVRLEVREIDDPAAAARHVDSSLDEFLRTYVPLAAERPEGLSPATLIELGAWYTYLADGADAPVATAMLRRAESCYERAMEAGENGGVSAKAQQFLAEVRGQLAGVAGMPMKLGQHELTALISLHEDVVDGQWEAIETGFATKRAGRARLRTPVKVAGSYTLQVRLCRTDGEGMFAVTLPVGEGEVLLKLDSSGLSGLELINGAAVVRNSTAVIGRELKNNNPYTVTVDVSIDDEKRARVAVRVDSRTWISWRGEVASLMAPAEWSPGHPGGIIIGSEDAAWTVGSMRLKTTDPACRRLR